MCISSTPKPRSSRTRDPKLGAAKYLSITRGWLIFMGGGGGRHQSLSIDSNLNRVLPVETVGSGFGAQILRLETGLMDEGGDKHCFCTPPNLAFFTFSRHNQYYKHQEKFENLDYQ